MATVPEINALCTQADTLMMHGRDILNGYTREKLAEIWNGIGPGWLDPAIRAKVTKAHEYLKAASLIHDVRYHETDKTRASFYYANKELEENGIIAAKAECAWYNPCRYWRCLKAKAARKLCDGFGWSAWVAGHQE